jgi:hypothetical protein
MKNELSHLMMVSETGGNPCGKGSDGHNKSSRKKSSFLTPGR